MGLTKFNSKSYKNKKKIMKTKKYVAVIIAGLILLVSIHACSKSSTTQQPPAGGNTKTINISGMAFPASTTVTKGTSVTWFNADAFAHTVTSDDGTSFNSGNLAGKDSFKYVANTVGTFTYHCNIHVGMTGSLTVMP
jgi:plastocyanin